MNFSLNYVWIAATQPSIPEMLMTNIVHIAEAYPQNPINIWIDIYGIGNHSESLMSDINEQNSIPNITFRSLEEIPAYSTNPLFRISHQNLKNSSDPLWQKVDLARLLVIDYSLLNDDVGTAIYSDMDRRLTRSCPMGLGSLGQTFATAFMLNPLDEALHKIEEHGIVVGRDYGRTRPENQFIGVSMSSLSFFRNVVVTETAKSIENGENGWYGHIIAFKDNRLSQLGVNIEDIAQYVPSMDPNKEAKKQYIKSPSSMPFCAHISPI